MCRSPRQIESSCRNWKFPPGWSCARFLCRLDFCTISFKFSVLILLALAREGSADGQPWAKQEVSWRAVERVRDCATSARRWAARLARTRRVRIVDLELD